MDTDGRKKTFEMLVLPEMDAAYGFARWAMGNPGDAQDVIQIAMARARRFIDGQRSVNSRVWILGIVRDTGLNWLRSRPHQDRAEPARSAPVFTDLSLPVAIGNRNGGQPPKVVLQPSQVHALRCAIAELPLEQREIVVLRDIENLSYREIARILEIPLTTMMSRLAQARDALERCLHDLEGLHGS